MKRLAIVITASMLLGERTGRTQNTPVNVVTPVGTVLLSFDGRAATPADVQARLAGVTERRYAFRFAPKNDIAQYNPVKPVAWALRFGTVEDPRTHARWLRDMQVVMVENSEMECSASTSRVVVGADKISFAHDPVQVAMMVDMTVRCTRRRDGFMFTCGGSVMADGTVPTGCNPTPMTTP